MTDFVVSKVAMSICALLVAGVLAGAVGSSLSPSTGDDLERVLTSLQRTVSSVAANGGEGSVVWDVPVLPSGEAVRMYIRGCSAIACAGHAARAAQVWPGLHVWCWDGSPLNRTMVESLDHDADPFEARSGDGLTILATWVLVDDSEELFLFVR